MVEAWASNSPNGTAAWAFQASQPEAVFGLDMARHADSNPGAKVDTVAMESLEAGPLFCALYGFAANGDGTPLWTYNASGVFCDAPAIGGSYQSIAVADDASVAVVHTYFNNSGGTFNGLYILDAQTGKPLLRKQYSPTEVPKQPAQGQVQVSATGQFVLHIVEPFAFVYERPTPTSGYTLRQVLDVPFFIGGAVSDSGLFVALANADGGVVYQWNGTGYTQAFSLSFPPGETWYPWDVQISTNDAAEELVAYGCISADVKQLRVIVFQLNSQPAGKPVTDYLTTKNTQLQNNPTLRMDKDFVALGLWGDAGESTAPTAVLLRAGSDHPLFEYTTPGSMFAVDVVAQDAATVYLTVGGKAVPANSFGNGGNAFAWKITVA